jgi:hypothetical protein
MAQALDLGGRIVTHDAPAWFRALAPALQELASWGAVELADASGSFRQSIEYLLASTRGMYCGGCAARVDLPADGVSSAPDFGGQ